MNDAHQSTACFIKKKKTKQEDVAFFSFPFNFEVFYMCEKESEGKIHDQDALIYV